MNKILLEKLREDIEKGRFPRECEHFGGADLIISDDPDRPIRDPEGIVFVVSPHAGALSWLVFQLKAVFNDQLDYMNKYQFYPMIGHLIQESLLSDELLFESMQFVVDEMVAFWQPAEDPAP